MSSVDEILVAARSGLLKLQAVAITDWHDGPLEGIARLSVGGGLWKFKMLAEVPRVDDLNDRLFVLERLSQDPGGTRIMEVVADRDLPLEWPYNDQPDSAAIRAAIDVALESATPATLVIGTADFNAVLKAWLIEADAT
jgi:hypothetical protein